MTRTAAQISGTDTSVPFNGEWASTFADCVNITMGSNFGFSNDWNNITRVGGNFAHSMFSGCSGDSFTMNNIFNLPPNITDVGHSFLARMFKNCNGANFTMNNIFNMPQGINASTQWDWFAFEMFYGCDGGAFTINSAFSFPRLPTTPTIAINSHHRIYYGSFANLGNNNLQTRLASEIINLNPTPNSRRHTFSDNGNFNDVGGVGSIDANWIEGLGYWFIPGPPAFTLSGIINTYNPNNPTTLQLMQGDTVMHTETISGIAGSGQVEQVFSIEGVEPGVYSLVITKAAHSTFTVNNITVDDADVDLTQDSREAVRVMTLVPGTITGGGVIDIFDLLAITNNMNQTASQAAAAGYPFADLNGDGIIDIFDLLILMDNMNKGAVVVQ
jgi:hypothetical protein